MAQGVIDDLDFYPEDNGEPLSESTHQFLWIQTIVQNLQSLANARGDTFVAEDLLWYPVQGDRTGSVAPDTMVVPGRAAGHRRSYLQWREGNIPPQVVFEIVSHTNTAAQMADKRAWHQRYGVHEYYQYDPQTNQSEGWLRSGDKRTEVPDMHGHISPLLGIRFDASGDELAIFHAVRDDR